MHKPASVEVPLRVLIIGAGFGGIGLGIELDKAGIGDFLILDKATEVGGTWRDNHYPGAACDVPSHLYSFSFEPKTDWSRRYAPQAEILGYIRHCVDKYQLRSRLRLGCEVSEAVFEADKGLWRVETTSGQQYWTRVLVPATGQLNRPLLPNVPGLERFAGPAFHSARWQHEVDLRGKRVAVIGTGASAIQFVPQIQPQAAQVTLFQRSAAYVIPKPDRAYTAFELALLRRWPALQRLDRARLYLQHEARALAFTRFPALLQLFKGSFRRHLKRGVKDPHKRAQLVPDYPMGCKRILISNDYYPALDAANVELVGSAIQAVEPEGVRTADGQLHPADVLIYGTGFAATEFLVPMRICGLGGRELSAVWQTGAEAYKGISISGFPNLFVLYGPNTNLGHNSIIYMLESQFRYVLGCLQAIEQQGLRYLDVKPQRQTRYNQALQQAESHTVWAQGCTSWYLNAAGKNTVNWPGFTFTYRWQTRRPELADYDCVR